jgi:hypothetical protein
VDLFHLACTFCRGRGFGSHHELIEGKGFWLDGVSLRFALPPIRPHRRLVKGEAYGDEGIEIGQGVQGLQPGCAALVIATTFDCANRFASGWRVLHGPGGV